ncbi:MAG: DUF4440 domain-containing protein [Candidatus Solibacter sp.]
MKLRTTLLPAALLCVLATTSCSPSAPPDTRAADIAALKNLDEEWSNTAAKHDVDGTVAFYADDAVVLPPNAPLAGGRKAIRDSWAAMLGAGMAISWKVSKADASGDLGYVHGTYNLAIQDPKGGAPVHDIGKFLEVWKRQADGKWKCIVDMFNSDLPAEPPPDTKK